VVRGGVCIAQQAKDELNRLFVEGWILEAIRMGRGRHGESTKTWDLRMRHCDATADASR
jgi:hypothetical protein